MIPPHNAQCTHTYNYCPLTIYYAFMGVPWYNVVYPKQNKAWLARKIYEPTKQKFRDELVQKVLEQRRDPTVVFKDRTFQVSFPELRCNIAIKPKPDKDLSRFQKRMNVNHTVIVIEVFLLLLYFSFSEMPAAHACSCKNLSKNYFTYYSDGKAIICPSSFDITCLVYCNRNLKRLFYIFVYFYYNSTNTSTLIIITIINKRCRKSVLFCCSFV